MSDPKNDSNSSSDRRITSAEYAAVQTQYEGETLALAISVLRNHHAAEDVAQEALLRLWQALEKGEVQERCGGWLRTVTLNLCKDRLRRDEFLKSVCSLDSTIRESLEATAGSAGVNERLVRIQEALGALTEKEKQTYFLIALSGLSFDEASEIMNIAPNTARAHWLNLRVKLRDRCI